MSIQHTHHKMPALRFLPLCLRLLTIGTFTCGLGFLPGVQAAQSNEYHIPAGTLSAQLSQFAQQSGVYLAGAAALTQGLSGTALNGHYGVEDGFRQLLSDHNLQVLRQADGSYLLAQDDGDDNILVIGQMDGGTVTEHSDSYTIKVMSTATRLNLSPRETPQSVSVVTQQRIQDQHMTRLEDAMSQVTGVTVLRESSYQTRFQSRGFTMDNVQEDGVSSSFQNSVNGMGSAEASSDSPDLAIYDHIDVLRGASGLTQGNGEPGGTVNMVRKRPTHEFQSSLSATAGRWDNYRSEFDVSGPLNDDATLRGRMVGVLQKQDSFVDYVNSDRKLMFGTLAYDLTSNTTVTSGISWQKTNTVPNLYGVPMSTDYTSPGLPRSTFLGASWNHIEFEKTNLFADIEHYFDNEWVLKSALNYIHANARGHFTGLYGNGTQGVGSDGNARMNNFLQRDNHSDQYSYNLDMSGPFTLFGRSHEAVLGGDYQKENYDNLFGSVADTQVANIYSWDPAALPEPNWPDYSRRYHYNLYQKGLFATTRLNLAEEWKLILGSRYSDVSYDFYATNRTTNVTSHNGYKVKGKLIPYGGLLWDFANDYTWYLSYAEIYKPQSSRDADGNFLPPVTGSNYETGIKGEFFDGGLNASVALFRIIQENRALSGINCDDCYVADGKVQSQGVEMEVSGRLSEGWQIFAGYTLNNSKYLEDNASNKGANYSEHTPQHLLRLYSSYRLPGTWDKWSFGAGLTAQSDTNTTYDIHQGGYTLYNANLSYQYSKQWSVSLTGNNLTDKVYYLPVSNRHRGGNNFYGEPRNLMLTAKWSY